VRSGRGQMASTLYDQMGKSGLRPDAVAKSTLIRAHTASNDITAAVTALLRMENALPLDDTASATATAAATTRTTAASKKRRAPLEAYHAIIEAAALSGQYSIALQLLERLMAIGYTPSETTARCLAASSAIGGHNRYRTTATPNRGKRFTNSSSRGKFGGSSSTSSSSSYSRDQRSEVKTAAVARIDYLLRVADMTSKGAQRSAHGVLYIALLADCLAAERIDVAKDIIGSRYA
jgi:hypothetical protein